MALAIFDQFLLAAWCLAIFLFVLLLIFAIVFICKTYVRLGRNRRTGDVERGIAMHVLSERDSPSSTPDVIEEARYCTVVGWTKGLGVATVIAFSFCLMFTCANDHMPVAPAVIIIAILWLLLWVFNIPVKKTARRSVATPPTLSLALTLFVQDRKQRIMSRPIVFAIVSAFLIAGAFVLAFAMAGMCLDLYNGRISTRLSRQYMSAGCPGGAPCHVYVTVSDESPSTALIVNFHTKNPAPAVVYYDTVSHAGQNVTAYPFTKTGYQFYMDIIDEPRWVHWVDLTNLTASTTYYFAVGSASSPSVEKRVRTAPDGDTFTFVAGGDMDVNDHAVETSQVAATHNPAFAIIGGDLAYANGWAPCYLKWDMWLNQWEQHMVTPDGCLIPLLAAIGNHEASSFYGADPVTQVRIHPFLSFNWMEYYFWLNDALLTHMQSAFYNRYLPHQLGLGTVPPALRPTYHSHVFGNNTRLLVLDSGHIAPISGAQTEWLQAQLSSPEFSSTVNKMAVYHVPMYPSVRLFSDYMGSKMRQYWLPLFDQHNMKLSFENHDHSYKVSDRAVDGIAMTDWIQRTYRLRNNEITSNGTQYIGDGCWGRTPRVTDPRWYLEKQLEKRHFLRVDVAGNNVTVSAIDYTNTVFDSVYL